MNSAYTTPPHLRPRELWRLDIPGEGLVQCWYLPVERVAVLHINGTVRDCIQGEREEDTFRAAALWRQGVETGVVLFAPERRH